MAEQYLAQLEISGQWSDPIVTDLKPLETFYQAEDYHQDYFRLNPENRYCQVIITPKLDKLAHKYTALLK